jgi:hypothetical protein
MEIRAEIESIRSGLKVIMLLVLSVRLSLPVDGWAVCRSDVAVTTQSERDKRVYDQPILGQAKCLMQEPGWCRRVIRSIV